MIKTDEERLVVIDDAKRLFSNYEEFKEDVEYKEGFDDERLCSYKVYCCGGLEFEGVETPCKVAFVDEEYVKEKDPEKRHRRYYVIAFSDRFSALQMRELGHLKWRIENNGFTPTPQMRELGHIKWRIENKGCGRRFMPKQYR